MTVVEVTDRYVRFARSVKLYREFRRGFNEAVDFWERVFREELRSCVSDSPFNVVVVRWFDARPDESIRHVLRSLGMRDYRVDVDDSGVLDELMTGFSGFPSSSVIILETRKPVTIIYSRKDLRVKAKKIDDAWKRALRSRHLPMAFPRRKVIILTRRDVEVDGVTPIKYLSYYAWRPASLARVLKEYCGIEDEVADRVAVYSGGSVEAVMNALKYGGDVIRVPADSLYHAIHRFEVFGRDSPSIPLSAKLAILEGRVTKIRFGQSLDGYERPFAGLDFRHGKVIVGAGIDVNAFHRVTGYRYRFIVGGDCGKCAYRSGCRYLYFHPARCS